MTLTFTTFTKHHSTHILFLIILMASSTRAALSAARALPIPPLADQLRRAPSVFNFWDDNRELFVDAWNEWERSEEFSSVPELDASLYDPRLRAAVEAAWADPNTEADVSELWTEVFPGVYETQFFDPDRLADLRAYLEAAWDAKIPLRPPYGIALNRGGAMLDPRSEGYLAAPNFQAFYRDLMDAYARPIARLLFPDVVGNDSQTFGFSIQWVPKKDTSLRMHTDASAATLNININLPGEEFSGSAVRFVDRATGEEKQLSFKPGTALIHHGSVMHASEPITEGERHNLVLWLYGDHGRVPHGLQSVPDITPRERWSIPDVEPDQFAPF